MGDTLLWWIALGYDAPRLMAETFKAAGHRAEQIVGYLKSSRAGRASTATSPSRGAAQRFPDDEVVFCEVNSLRDGAFNLPPATAPSRCWNRSSPTA